MGERRLDRVHDHLNIGAVLALLISIVEQLDKFDRVGDKFLLVLAKAGPVSIGALDDTPSPALGHSNDRSQLTLAVRLFGRNGNVLKVKEYGHLLCHRLSAPLYPFPTVGYAACAAPIHARVGR